MIEPERIQRVIPARARRQSQQIVRETIARVLAVEIEAAAGRMRPVIAVNGAVVVLISEAERMSTAIQFKLALPFLTLLQRWPGTPQGVPKPV